MVLFVLSVFNMQQSSIDDALDNTKRKINVVRIANGISSYAKRSEGHLLMYIIGREQIDREKFFKRHASIIELMEEITPFLVNDIQRKHLAAIKDNTVVMQATGSRIIEILDQGSGTSEPRTLHRFHDASSAIRKSGVSIVEATTELLEGNNIDFKGDHRNISFLLLFALILTLCLFVVVYFLSLRVQETKKRAEKANQTNSEFLDSLIDTYYRSDVEGRVIIVSKSATALLGYSIDELLGQPLADLCYDPDGRAQFLKNLQKNGGEVSGYETKLKDKNGKKIWVSTSSHFYKDDNGNILGVEGVARDITERKKSEAQILAAKEEAVNANMVKSNFLANISHELRTPLNSIIGYSEALLGGHFGEIENPKHAEYTKDILNSGNHLLNLINDILDISKIEAQKEELYELTFNVPAMMNTALQCVQQRAVAKNISLCVDKPPLLPGLLGDERRVIQIFINLLNNAIKFSPEGGQVSFSVKADSCHGYVFSVEDNGIGIAPEKIATVVKPFEQIGDAMVTPQEGTGLGLAISKSLIQLHNGTLDIESELGKGTTVRICFPPERII